MLTKREQLKTAKRVVVDKDTTTIIGGAGARSAIDGRMTQIRHQGLGMTPGANRVGEQHQAEQDHRDE